MASTHLNIPLPSATSPRQSLDLFLPGGSSSKSPLLVYVHGGAWRSDSKDDLTSTLMPFLLESTQLPIANLEYRLAPLDPHPAQTNDIIAALSFLTDPTHRFDFEEQEGKELRWDRSRIYFIGHSAGAFMGLSLLLASPYSPQLFKGLNETTRNAIQGMIGVDGIYDLVELLDEYPTYAYFVEDAFGKDVTQYEAVSPARWNLFDRGTYLQFLILHSKEDELLTLRQSRTAIRRITTLLGTETISEEAEDDGRMFQSAKGSIEVDFKSITGKHEVLPHSRELAERIAVWIKSKESLQQ